MQQGFEEPAHPSTSRAGPRLLTHCGVNTAMMMYNPLPINDVFRKMDENTVLGLMDLKGMGQPFFFVLRRIASLQG